MTAPASTAVIRQWARDNGLPVGDRGRLSPQLLSAFASSGTSTPKAATQAATKTKAKPTTAAKAASTPIQAPRRQARAVRVRVHPTPGATGISHKVAARSS